MRRRLIVHAPAPIDNGPLLVGNQPAQSIPERFRLLFVVPEGQKLHFHVSKCSRRVLQESLQTGTDNFSDIAAIVNAVIGSFVVLLNRLEPPHIIVGMWHNVHIQDARRRRRRVFGNEKRGRPEFVVAENAGRPEEKPGSSGR